MNPLRIKPISSSSEPNTFILILGSNLGKQCQKHKEEELITVKPEMCVNTVLKRLFAQDAKTPHDITGCSWLRFRTTRMKITQEINQRERRSISHKKVQAIMCMYVKIVKAKR